jgi:hypothetical protein
MRRRTALVLTAILLAGCADLQPFAPPVAGEIPPGPGLLSGPDGTFVVTPDALPDRATAAAPPPAEPAPPPRQGLRLPPPDHDLAPPPPR